MHITSLKWTITGDLAIITSLTQVPKDVLWWNELELGLKL